jgi:hypothetical protein
MGYGIWDMGYRISDLGCGASGRRALLLLAVGLDLNVKLEGVYRRAPRHREDPRAMHGATLIAALLLTATAFSASG